MPRHPFHIVDPRPWPILSSMGALCIASGFIAWFYDKDARLLLVRISQVAYVAGLWWRDVIRESTYMGHHTSYVARGLRLGFALFLLSEGMFFFGFFELFFIGH